MITPQILLEQEKHRLGERGVLGQIPTQPEISLVYTRICSAHEVEKLSVSYVCEYENALQLLIRIVHCGQHGSYVRGDVHDVLVAMAKEFLALRAQCVAEVVKAIRAHKMPFPWNYSELQQVAGWAARQQLWEEHNLVYDKMLGRD